MNDRNSKIKAERVNWQKMKFAYEDLDVWNKSVEFAIEVIDIVEKINTDRKHYRLLEQILITSFELSALSLVYK
jgi:hypothetical protein